VSDDIDRAQAREEEMRQDALLERIRSAHPDPEHEAEDHPDCQVCGEPIPVKRRAAVPGVKTCFACQQELERALNPRGKAKAWPTI
jgi:phage/conjugal plasmid C-4 type zinc finger TraR family protein